MSTHEDTTRPSDPEPHPSRRAEGRHVINIGHLVMGLVFLAYVAIWGLVQSDVVTDGDIRYLLPVPWVAGGAVGLTVAVTGGSQRRR